MEGKKLLNKCSQNEKDIIVCHFGSLENFYFYAYYVGVEKYKNYLFTKQIDENKSERLKDYLRKIGINESLSDDLVEEIAGDFDERMVETRISQTLGDNWRDKISAIEEFLNS